MDVEAVTDEIPSNALSCSPLIELSNLQQEFWEFSVHVEAVKSKKGRIYGIIADNEIRNGLEELEYENKDKYFQPLGRTRMLNFDELFFKWIALFISIDIIVNADKELLSGNSLQKFLQPSGRQFPAIRRTKMLNFD